MSEELSPTLMEWTYAVRTKIFDETLKFSSIQFIKYGLQRSDIDELSYEV
jgi:hypothetical protein